MSIATYSRSCQSLFRKLCAGWDTTPNPPGEFSLSSITRESERFEVWARNIAALQDARLPSSLQHRLRHDRRTTETVERALLYLVESLELALPIISGQKPNETWPISPQDTTSNENDLETGDLSQGSEIVELYLSIQNGITHLFRLSTIIRKKPEVDEYVKAASRLPMDAISDIIRVGDKYPKVNEAQSWLKVHLGTAITRRRQYLLYRKDHQEKMQQEYAMKVGPDGITVWSGEKASTYIPAGDMAGQVHQTIEIPASSTGRGNSQTNYADSSFAKEGGLSLLRTPPLPRGKDGKRVEFGEHFECPYCWRITSVSNKQHWKKHIMTDLRPYVCTFEACSLMMFESQREWFYHELRFHREQWKCLLCPYTMEQTYPSLQLHVNVAHPELSGTGLDSYFESCLLPRITASSCPICEEWASRLQKVNSEGDVSLKQFRQHLGLHMEQLALAALPIEEDDSDDESDGSSSNREPSPLGHDDQEFGDDEAERTSKRGVRGDSSEAVGARSIRRVRRDGSVVTGSVVTVEDRRYGREEPVIWDHRIGAQDEDDDEAIRRQRYAAAIRDNAIRDNAIRVRQIQNRGRNRPVVLDSRPGVRYEVDTQVDAQIERERRPYAANAPVIERSRRLDDMMGGLNTERSRQLDYVMGGLNISNVGGEERRGDERLLGRLREGRDRERQIPVGRSRSAGGGVGPQYGEKNRSGTRRQKILYDDGTVRYE